MNGYSYAGDNPVDGTDPNGTELMTTGGCIGSIQACDGGGSGGSGGGGGGNSGPSGGDTIAYIEGMVLALSGGNHKGPEATADSCDVQGSDATNCLNSPPDYTTAGATLCIPGTVVCGTLSLTHTKYGEMYCGFGAGDSMSMRQGDLFSGNGTGTEINSFVGDWGVSGPVCSGEGIGVCATFVDSQPQTLPWDSNFSSSFGVEGALTGNPRNMLGVTEGTSYSATLGYNFDCIGWGSAISSRVSSVGIRPCELAREPRVAATLGECMRSLQRV